MPAGIELKRVQKGKGKVHLTPALRAGARIRPLCGQEFAPRDAREVDAEPSCSICERRRRDPAAVSSAFFLEDAGERLLELSLAQAQARPPRAKPDPAEQAKPDPAERAKPDPAEQAEPRRPSAPPPAARRLGELDTSGLREFSEDVYLAPDGVIVRIKGGRLAEVVGEGRYQLIRRGDRLTLRAGGVVVEATVSEVSARGDA